MFEFLVGGSSNLGSFSLSPVDFSLFIYDDSSFSAAIALCVRHFDSVAEITKSVCGNFVHQAEVTLISLLCANI